MEYVLHMHGIWNMPGVCMETLVSVNPLAQNPSSLLPPSHEITSSLQHSGPKTEPKKIPSEQLCFSVVFFRGVYAACTRRLQATYPHSRQYVGITRLVTKLFRIQWRYCEAG